MIVEIKDKNEYDQILSQGKKDKKFMIIDFYTSWCTNCKKIEKPLQMISEQYNENTIFMKIDAEENDDIADDLNVKGLPTISILNENGTEIQTFQGSDMDKIKEMICTYALPSTTTSNNKKRDIVNDNVNDNANDNDNDINMKKVKLSTTTTKSGMTTPLMKKSVLLPDNKDNKYLLNVATFGGVGMGGHMNDGSAGMGTDGKDNNNNNNNNNTSNNNAYQLAFSGLVRPAIDVAEDLQKSILKIYGKFLSSDGKEVDYDSMAKSEEFYQYVMKTMELQAVNLKMLSAIELKAFFLNLYNALCIHGNVIVGPPDSTIPGSIGHFFGNVAYVIDEMIFSLDDIEHGILRGNQIHPTSGKRFFPNTDGRDQRRCDLVLPLDPRIHCALVCGAKSCPPIRIFSKDNLDKGLTLATNLFCDTETSIDHVGKKIKTSKIFMWYGNDIGKTNAQRIRWLADYVSKEKREMMLDLLAKDDFTLEFNDYNWATNKKKSS